MKKEYVEPVVKIFDIKLEERIAKSCNANPNSHGNIKDNQGQGSGSFEQEFGSWCIRWYPVTVN